MFTISNTFTTVCVGYCTRRNVFLKAVKGSLTIWCNSPVDEQDNTDIWHDSARHIAAFNCLRPSRPGAGGACRVAGHSKRGPSKTCSPLHSFSVLPGCAVLQLSPFIVLGSAASFYSLLVSFHSSGNQDHNNLPGADVISTVLPS